MDRNETSQIPGGGEISCTEDAVDHTEEVWPFTRALDRRGISLAQLYQEGAIRRGANQPTVDHGNE